jgi:DNA-binding LacI/PurR family transcriptional regulator
MFGLGKPRTKFGKWVDKEGLTQSEIAEESKVGKNTISNMCSDPEYRPKIETWVKVKRALEKLGYNLDRNDFFDM